MLQIVGPIALFGIPLISGVICGVFRHDLRVFWASICIGALVSVGLIISPIAARQGATILNPALGLIILIIAGIWPLFFFLGFKVAKPFREIWVEKYGTPNEVKSYEETFK
ncbi:MAG: hypothetical protein CMK07_14815 [Ponticaulis sp.]|nr:hypothetical protein [Ponticaulis sp.]